MTISVESLIADLEAATTVEEVSLINGKLQSLFQYEAVNNNNSRRISEELRYRTEISQAKKDGIVTTNEADILIKQLTGIDTGNLNIYLHVSLSGGDSKVPIGLKNDGVQTLVVTATFRSGELPTSDVLTIIDATEWRVNIRNSEGAIYDIVNIIFNAGISTFNYTTTNYATVCEIVESDFEVVELVDATYNIKLVNPVIFKVFRDFV